MATYTILLRDITESVKPQLMDYPIFDEGYRLPLNKKILDHYRFQEIGFGTPDMFIFHLRMRMNEIMPYYNQLYQSEKLSFDPLSTISIATLTEDTSRSKNDSESQSNSTGSSENKSRAVSSNSPQTQLSGNEDYASSLADSTGATSTEGTGHDTVAATGESGSLGQSVTDGRQGSAAALLAEWRSVFLNIDLMVINSVNDLFMGVWNNGDTMPIDTPYIYGLYGWRF